MQVMLKKLEEANMTKSQLQQACDSLQEQLLQQRSEQEATEKDWASKLYRAEEQKRDEVQVSCSNEK
jgi:hypothetical protein